MPRRGVQVEASQLGDGEARGRGSAILIDIDIGSVTVSLQKRLLRRLSPSPSPSVARCGTRMWRRVDWDLWESLGTSDRIRPEQQESGHTVLDHGQVTAARRDVTRAWLRESRGRRPLERRNKVNQGRTGKNACGKCSEARRRAAGVDVLGGSRYRAWSSAPWRLRIRKIKRTEWMEAGTTRRKGAGSPLMADPVQTAQADSDSRKSSR